MTQGPGKRITLQYTDKIKTTKIKEMKGMNILQHDNKIYAYI